MKLRKSSDAANAVSQIALVAAIGDTYDPAREG